MKHWSLKAVVALVAAAAACCAQTIAISGVVKDRAGQGVDSASVILRNANLETMTGPDGSFTLSGGQAAAGNSHRGPARALVRVALDGNSFAVFADRQAAVTLEVYRCDGRLLASRAISVSPGAHAVNLPQSAAEALRVVRVSVAGTHSACTVFGAGATAVHPSPREDVVGRPSGKAAAGDFSDEIEVKKAGLLLLRLGVTAPETTGIRIAMIPSAGEVSDADGNVYQTVQIGTQIWTVENLRTTKLNDGTPLPQVTDDIGWGLLSTPAYCWYGNDTVENKATYGGIYNGHAVHTGKLAPTGWHVPTDDEWGAMATYLGGDNLAGNLLKEAGTVRWKPPNSGAVNSTGFSALPGGCRMPAGSYSSIGLDAGWWTATSRDSTTGCYRALYTYHGQLERGWDVLQHGFYVRCVKD